MTGSRGRGGAASVGQASGILPCESPKKNSCGKPKHAPGPRKVDLTICQVTVCNCSVHFLKLLWRGQSGNQDLESIEPQATSKTIFIDDAVTHTFPEALFFYRAY